MWRTYGHDCIFFPSILLISNSTVSRGIWKNIHSWLFRDFKLHSSFGLVQFWSSLKNSLVHVFPKLHSKPYYYLYYGVKPRSNEGERWWELQLSLAFEHQLSSTLMHSHQPWIGSKVDKILWEFMRGNIQPAFINSHKLLFLFNWSVRVEKISFKHLLANSHQLSSSFDWGL